MVRIRTIRPAAAAPPMPTLAAPTWSVLLPASPTAAAYEIQSTFRGCAACMFPPANSPFAWLHDCLVSSQDGLKQMGRQVRMHWVSTAVAEDSQAMLPVTHQSVAPLAAGRLGQCQPTAPAAAAGDAGGPRHRRLPGGPHHRRHGGRRARPAGQGSPAAAPGR